MPTVDDIATAIAAVTHPTETPDWDPAGLQLGDPGADVRSVAVCHEVTEEIASRLATSPVDLLVTYHPLLFNPGTTMLASRSPGGRAYRLITSGVSLLVTHTDFDSAPRGSADSLAALVALHDVRPFGGDDDTGLPAIGRYGRYEGTLGSIDAIIADSFGFSGVRVTGDREADVGSVAVVPGSGASFIEAAADVAEVLITGDVGHHRCVTAQDLGLAIVDPGHVATERPGMRALIALVAEASGLDVVDMTDVDPQTWT